MVSLWSPLTLTINASKLLMIYSCRPLLDTGPFASFLSLTVSVPDHYSCMENSMQNSWRLQFSWTTKQWTIQNSVQMIWFSLSKPWKPIFSMGKAKCGSKKSVFRVSSGWTQTRRTEEAYNPVPELHVGIISIAIIFCVT